PVNRAPSEQLPFASVIVPVLDGESTIADCLDAVLATHYPADRREILVIDNGSSDGTAALIQARPVRYLREERRGVSNARNRGLAESRGEILAFVDADCLGEPHWFTDAPRPLHTPAEPPAARMLGNWQRFAFTSNPAYPITANAAYRRDVLERIGPFDPHMTRL